MSLFESLDGPDPARFDGAHYDAATDDIRLTGQLRRIHDLMADGRWRTLDRIAVATGDAPASVSAQLRHLRKERFGAYLVETRAVEGHRGLFEYRMGAKGSGRPRIGHRQPEVVSAALAAADALIPHLRHAANCRVISEVLPGSPACTCGLDDKRRVWTEARQATRRAYADQHGVGTT